MLPKVANLDIEPITKLFRALGDESRVRIIALLTHGELCVCHIEAAIGLSQPAASRHLSLLRAAGVVIRRRSRSWVYYRLKDHQAPESRRVIGAIRRLADDDSLKRDLQRLRTTTGPEA